MIKIISGIDERSFWINDWSKLKKDDDDSIAVSLLEQMEFLVLLEQTLGNVRGFLRNNVEFFKKYLVIENSSASEFKKKQTLLLGDVEQIKISKLYSKSPLHNLSDKGWDMLGKDVPLVAKAKKILKSN